MGSPYSTIFLIRSNKIPTERETTVNAAIEKNNGGISCPKIHLSKIGTLEYLVEKYLINLLCIVLFEKLIILLMNIKSLFQIFINLV